MKSEFGLIGLGVMGKSLSRNLARQGFSLSLYNRHIRNKEENVAENFIQNFSQELSECQGFDRIHDFVFSLEKPRKILLMIKAGEATDIQIEEIGTYLDSGDIIIDGGNAHFKDTQRRMEMLSTRGVEYIGAGISGGEEGALHGPSIMPGGSREAYEQVQKYLEAISATDNSGTPCCTYIGPSGAGHFVKMVHNGIEYGEMQLLAEVYSILSKGMDKNPNEVAEILSNWTKTDINSYLLDITSKILREKDGDEWLINNILDKAGNKGTGSWNTITAAELGVPISTLTASLYARFLSFFKDQRVKAHELYAPQVQTVPISPEQLRQAYRLARIINHHQGLHLIHAASEEFSWELNLSDITRIWTNGCIIQSEFMGTLPDIITEEPLLLLHPNIKKTISLNKNDLANTVAKALQSGFYIPAFSSTLNYLNGFTSEVTNANIIQAQRDFFGAHTYQRKDNPNGEFYHTNWNK